MATIDTRDPVQGLVDFTKDVKPFHTKILEVWVEYIHSDQINATIVDQMDMVIKIHLDRQDKFCKYGFDTQPWNELWLGDSLEDIIPGTINYCISPSVCFDIPKAMAYQVYYDYTLQVWKWMNGQADEPIIDGNDETSKYYLLAFEEILTECRDYFGELANDFDYWYDQNSKTLYKRNANFDPQSPTDTVWEIIGMASTLDVCVVDGSVSSLTCWREEPGAYLSSVQPPDAIETDLWLNTISNSLYQMIAGSWVQIHSLTVSTGRNAAPPTYPVDWLSNWDTMQCLPPFGETVAYTYVEDVISFEHGSEIFLWDNIRGNVFDPVGNFNTISSASPDYDLSLDYPITYRTTISHDDTGRYTISRQEVSIITEPDNPEVVDNVREIHLQGFEFDGLGVATARRGIRLQDFRSLIVDNATGQVMTVLRPTIDNDSFKFTVEDGLIVVHRLNGQQEWVATQTTSNNFPFSDGQIVYLFAHDNLPSYTLTAQDKTRPVSLMPYTPYKIKFVDGVTDGFSLQLVKQSVKFFDRTQTIASGSTLNDVEPVPGTIYKLTDNGLDYYWNPHDGEWIETTLKLWDRVPYTNHAGLSATIEDYELDTSLMGPDDHLTFTSGYGTMYIGFGHPIPFIELNSGLGTEFNGSFTDQLSSNSAAIISSQLLDIIDVVGVSYNSSPYHAFVVKGIRPFAPGDVIEVVGSNTKVNDGEWIVIDHITWSNEWVEVEGELTAAPQPSWWNNATMGEWPTPILTQNPNAPGWEEYAYTYYTTIVLAQMPSQQQPIGKIVMDQYAFSEPTVSENTAATTVVDALSFGSMVYVTNNEGQLELMPEVGVPGVTLTFFDTVNCTIADDFTGSDSGIMTIGSYDAQFYDVGGYDVTNTNED